MKKESLILSEEVYLVPFDKESKIELISKSEASRIAKEKELDLVQISEKDGIPICKIFDLDDYLYKKEKTKKKSKRSDNKLKTVKFTVNIQDTDLERKINQVIKFLDKFNSVKIVIMRKKLRRRFDLISIVQEKIISIVKDKHSSFDYTKKDNDIILRKKK